MAIFICSAGRLQLAPLILIPRIKLLSEMSGNIGSVKLESIAIYTKLCLDHRETRDVEASFDKQHHYRRKSVLRCL